MKQGTKLVLLKEIVLTFNISTNRAVYYLCAVITK